MNDPAAPEVAYVPAPDGKSLEVGMYDGSPIYCFGFHRIRLEDGFCYLSPHTGFAGTVSEDPIPLDATSFGDDKTYRELLIESAREARAAHES